MKKYINIFKAEFVRLTGEFKSYKLEYIFSNINIYLLFIGLYYGMDKKYESSFEITNFVLGLIVWWYAVTAIQSVSSIIQTEARQGTLEQLFMTKSNIIHIVLFKLMAQFLFETIQIICVTLLSLISFNLLNKINIHMNYVTIFLIILITIIGLWGIGYFIAGLSVLYKRVDAVARATTNLILFFSGVIIPISGVPMIFNGIAKALPFYWAMETIRQSIDFPFTKLFNYSFYMLCTVAVIWIAVGITLFKILTFEAIKKGSIAHY